MMRQCKKIRTRTEQSKLYRRLALSTTNNGTGTGRTPLPDTTMPQAFVLLRVPTQISVKSELKMRLGTCKPTAAPMMPNQSIRYGSGEILIPVCAANSASCVLHGCTKKDGMSVTG